MTSCEPKAPTDRLAGTLLGTALGDALGLPAEGMSAWAVARRFVRLDHFRLLGSTGFVSDDTEHFCVLRYGDARMPSLVEAISAGGDSDPIGAILGGWLGALHGESGLPGDLIRRTHDGPFDPNHLRALAACLGQVRKGRPCLMPRYSTPAALARSLALYPVILGHGFRRLVPF